MSVQFSINEVQFLTNLMLDLAHGNVELENCSTEYDYAHLNYQSISDNLITKLMDFETELRNMPQGYVSKVVFAEYDDVEELKKYRLLQVADYNGTEISSDNIKSLLSDLYDNPEEFDYTREDLIDDLNNSLGSDVANALIRGFIDFVIVV